MGDAQNPNRFQRYAPPARKADRHAPRAADRRRLQPSFAQVVGYKGGIDPNIWYEWDLTFSSCLPYAVRAEGGRGSSKGPQALLSQEDDTGPKG